MFVLLRLMATAFYQILYMSIIAVVIGLVILLIQKIVNRRISPKCNYLIWMVFIFVLIFPISIPSKFSVYNYVDVSNIKMIENRYVNNKLNRFYNKDNNVVIGINDDVALNNDVFDISLRIIIADILLLISLLNILRTLTSYKDFMLDIGEDEIYDKRILDIFNSCKNELKVKRNIKLINQNIVNSPAVFGICNVRILLTETILSRDDDALKNIFLHELSHYKRRDNYINFLIMFLSSLYWFNPVIKYMFKHIRNDIEFATDELAIKNMSVEEARDYCQTIIDVAEICSSKLDPILAFSIGLENIDKRIDLISLKAKFKKFSVLISSSTLFIILMICLLFYPTSFGLMNTPKLYLKTEDGKLTEIINTDDFSNATPNIIYLKPDSKVELIVKNGKPNELIYYIEENTLSDSNFEKMVSVFDDKTICFQEGEYFYKFAIENEIGRISNYAIKIVVE